MNGAIPIGLLPCPYNKDKLIRDCCFECKEKCNEAEGTRKESMGQVLEESEVS